MKLKKVLCTIAMVIILIYCAGFIFSLLGEKLSTDLVTMAIMFFTGYGIYAFVKRLKEKG